MKYIEHSQEYINFLYRKIEEDKDLELYKAKINMKSSCCDGYAKNYIDFYMSNTGKFIFVLVYKKDRSHMFIFNPSCVWWHHDNKLNHFILIKKCDKISFEPEQLELF